MVWHVGIVAPKAHLRVQARLAELDIPVFYPRLKRWIRHARIRMAREQPLLGPYVFVDLVRTVSLADEPITLLRASNGQPSVIPEQIVYSWRLRYLAGEFDLTMRHIPVGALIRVSAGEFAEQLALVAAVRRDMITFVPKGSSRMVTTRRRNVSAA